MANGAGGSITPFFTIWTEPRATIRRIVDTDPTRNVIALAAIGPAVSALANQWSKALGNNANLSVLWPIWVALSVAFAAVLGVVSLYISGVILKWSGGLLGGVASRVEVRAALAWGQIPAIAAEIILLLAVLQGIAIPHPTAAEMLHRSIRRFTRSASLKACWQSGEYRRAVLYRRGASILRMAGVLRDSDPGSHCDGRPRSRVWVLYGLVHH